MKRKRKKRRRGWWDLDKSDLRRLYHEMKQAGEYLRSLRIDADNERVPSWMLPTEAMILKATEQRDAARAKWNAAGRPECKPLCPSCHRRFTYRTTKPADK